MAAPSLTYTLTNGSTADATQVMQNFSDLLNGITDSTKDLSINALTVAGTANLKGPVNLGDASSDDIQFNGSLATNLNVKTTNTYNVGAATLGLAGAYFGTGSTQTARIVAANSLAASRTYTLPDAGAAANFLLSQGAQTVVGVNTFSNGLVFGNGGTNLNWYEEGTFSPTITTTGTQFSSLTYAYQVGHYTRIGRVVYFIANISWTNTTGSPTGTILVSGLPYTAKNTSSLYSSVSLQTLNIDFTGTPTSFIGEIDPNTTTISAVGCIDNNTSSVVNASGNNGAVTRAMLFTGFYFV